MANLFKTAFREVKFKDCKLLGLRFDKCEIIGLVLGFENCVLDHASFFRTKLQKTVFKNCRLKESDFSEADFSASVFDGSDLSGAVFDNTVLEKADFRLASNFNIDPERNRIKKAKFALDGLPGLLGKYGIEIS